jgi:ABC-2 type transport system ATP-binding protein
MIGAGHDGAREGGGIHVRGLCKRYGERVAIANFSIDVRSGATVGVLGPNGSGKSSLIGVLGGFIHPSSGEIYIDGSEVGSSALLGRVGVLPDGTPFPDDVFVGKWLDCLAALQGFDAPDRVVDEVLRVIGEVEWRGLRFRELSFGMRRRVGLAQAFMGSPRVVILDEPTEGLDAGAVEATYRLISDCATRRGTCVIASHDRSVLERCCDEIAMMANGGRSSTEVGGEVRVVESHPIG